jgi:hypothetical protein
MQVSEKGDFDWALVSCAAAGQKTGSHWTQVTVFLGAVAPIPYAVNSPLLTETNCRATPSRRLARPRDLLGTDAIKSIVSRPECYGVEKAHGAHGDVDAGG